MKPGKILDGFFSRAPKASQRQMEEASPRMWQRIAMGLNSGPYRSEMEAPEPQRRAHWPVPAVAAAMIVLAIAAFAYRDVLKPRTASLVAVQKDGGVVSLADGSLVEMRPNTEFKLETAEDGTRIRLSRGSIIVTAAKQRNGHLYVQTRDATVSVVGTVFLVNAEEAGSRVAVIQGEVHVEQDGVSRKLLPGDQMATNPLMKIHPVSQEISWSRSAETHLALLQKSVPSQQKPLEFEVATQAREFATISIRPQPPLQPGVGPGPGLSCHGVDGVATLNGGDSRQVVGQGRCLGVGVTLSGLIALAYGVPRELVSGVPSWDRPAPGANGFRVEAVAENPATTTIAELKLMLQSMMADRFKLKIRRDSRDSQGYALLIGKEGFKLKEVVGQETSSPSIVLSGGRRVIKGRSSLAELSNYIGFNIHTMDLGGGLEHTVVVDKTQLMGIYDYEFVMPEFSPIGGARSGGGPGVGGPIEQDGAPWSAVLEQHLGLQLRKERVTVDSILIERAEKPSEN